ncbi:hypothetical protein PVA45_02540 [Entomospira entomophila]|uniref:Uncharacterized protein n=1 Tax=Entomospira entomophila TaxID=2719988 RepID=A0A968GBM1_9SPIO|nr:hypothetical protein [Entomospira entomophilus]NIZ40391.1 hypothetical protein [Entomospira entomophilus]WDI35950.1 hypothetical protein PVA45_02540 [Entomospira entomophilus]
MMIITLALSLILIGRFAIDNVVDNREFSYENFYYQQKIFMESEEFTHLHETALRMQASMQTLEQEEFTHQWNHSFITNQNEVVFSYLKSSRSNLRSMAEAIMHQLKEEYPNHDWRFFDTIRARNRFFSALLNEPQSYLFLLTSSTQNQSLIATAIPSLTENSYTIQFYPDAIISSHFLENLLTVYDEKVR